MRRKLVITVDSDETAENPGFVDLMDNLHDAWWPWMHWNTTTISVSMIRLRTT